MFLRNSPEFAPYGGPMQKAQQCKYKEIIREALGENQRRGNYIRIYPAPNSNLYDKFFVAPRPYNNLLYRVFYSDDVLPLTQVKMSPYNQTAIMQGNYANAAKAQRQ